MVAFLKEIWNYRGMIKSLTRQDLRGRYKASMLGFLWTFINPLLQLLVYTFVFGYILKNPADQYYLFLFVALVPWIFFSSCLTGGSGLLISYKDMLKKIYFPREVLPISFTLTNLVNMLLTFIVMFVVLIFAGRGITLAILYLPIIILIEILLCAGITFISSACTVYFRDLQHILGIVGMAWQFMTPIMYEIPAGLETLFAINPMTSVVIAYRDILYYGRAPQLSTLLWAVAFGVVMLVIGMLVFNRLKKGFVEEL